MIRILLLISVLSGCIVDDYDYRVTRPDVIYVGDSLCWKVFDTDTGIKGIYENEDWLATAQREAGIVTNCVPGRKATDIRQLPDGYAILFLALGTNDIGRTPVDEFRLHYQTLVLNVDVGTLYCILPNKVVLGVDAEPYRQVIRETCANVIDPLDYGVRYRAKDTVHMTRLDHRFWLRAILELIGG